MPGATVDRLHIRRMRLKMNSYLKIMMAMERFCSTVVLVLFCTICLALPAHANLTQWHILNAGINLGWAEASLDLNVDGNAETVAEALAATALHVEAAAEGFGEPYLTDRQAEGVDQRIINMINNYAQQAPRLSLDHRASYINRIWGTYRQSFQTTFMDRPRSSTDRTTGYFFYSNCDFFILDVGYHYGRAQFTAPVEGHQSRTYQTGANGSMRNSIESGLSVGLDGYQYGTETNVLKACCAFGPKAEWLTLPTFQFNSPAILYADNLGRLQNIVFNANLPPGACGVTCANTYCNCDHDKRIPMPSVIGLSGASARIALQMAGLQVQTLPGSSGSIPGGVGKVELQDHSMGIMVCPDAVVKITVRSTDDHARESCTRDYPGSIPSGRDANDKVICNCPTNTLWNTDRTRCVPQLPAQELCTRDYPGSVPGGRDANNKAICNCPSNMLWNTDRTRCVPQLPPQELCTRDYPGSIANGQLPDGKINCECPGGYTWNNGRTACEKSAPPDQLCARDYPGSIANGRLPDGKINCECPQGKKWNVGATHCIGSSAPVDRTPTPACSLDMSLMSGSSNLCTSFAEYHDADHNIRTVHIVNDSRFEQGFSAPTNWHRSRYQECQILRYEECPTAAPPPSACTQFTSYRYGDRRLCTSFAAQRDSDRNIRTVHIVNDSRFQQGFQVPSNWYRSRYQECQILQREECH